MKADNFYEFDISSYDQDDIYKLTQHFGTGYDDIIGTVVEQEYHRLYSKIRYSSITETEEYLIEFVYPGNQCTFLKFTIWPNEHPDIGVVYCTVNTSDAFIFRTDHEGRFKVYVFKGLKSRESKLYELIIAGKLDDELKKVEEEAIRYSR
jgi:hypothetical protein